MIYGTAAFSYKPALRSIPKFDVSQLVKTPHGPGRIQARRFNGSDWEYGLEIVGITKGGSVWFTESNLS